MSKNILATFSEATINWLGSKQGLADASRLAYRGEVNRMAEHLVQAGIHDVRRISRSDWWDYLASLERAREGVETKRLERLRRSSVQQARRITRDFFMWALEDRAIDWIPHLPELGSQAVEHEGQSTEPKRISNALIRVLLGEAKYDDVLECRACLVLNLVFWGAMKPAELAGLKIGDFLVGKRKVVCSLPKREVILPRHIGRLWGDYAAYRSEIHKTTPQQLSPLITHIEREEPVSMWGIWAIFRAWNKSTASSQNERLCPRQLRDVYLEMICADGSDRLALACKHGGQSERRIKASNVSPTQSKMASINGEVVRQFKAVEAESQAYVQKVLANALARRDKLIRGSTGGRRT